MKILRDYRVAGALYVNDTGVEAQVSDQVTLYLDRDAEPLFPVSIVATIQHPITKIECGSVTSYALEYDEANIAAAGRLLLRSHDIIDATVVSGVLVVATQLVAHEADTTAHPAANISFTPTGSIAATNVQAAIAELDSKNLVNELNDISVKWPLTGSIYAIGDSQTWGTNATSKPYVTAGRIQEAYRWINILATTEGRSLTVNNLGKPGQKISDVPNTAGQTIWHAFGEVPENWSGVTTLFLGYNNSDANTITHPFYNIIERSYTAFIARCLVDDYAGIGLSGFGATGITQDAFTTTGTALTVAVPAGEAATRMAFYYGNPNGSNLMVSLAVGQYVQFTVSNKKAIALFVKSANSGGDYSVTVNGVPVAFGKTAYTGVGGNDPTANNYPLATWLEDLPASSIVRLTATTETVIWQAYGTIPITGALTSQKQIILAGPGGNQNVGRTDRMLKELFFRAREAAAKFADYPVFTADTWTKWNVLVDDEADDLSHFTDVGNAKIANAFKIAGRNRPVMLDSPVVFSEMLDIQESLIHVNLDPATWGVNSSTNSAALSSPTALIQVRCLNTALSSIVANSHSSGSAGPLVRPCYDSTLRTSVYVDWNLPLRIAFTLQLNNITPLGESYVNFGVLYNKATVSGLVAKGVGIKIANNQLFVQVYNTNLTLSPAVATLQQDVGYRVTIVTAAGGSIKFYLNGALIYSTTSGPVGNGSANSSGIEVAGTNSTDAAFHIFTVSQMTVAHLPLYTRI